MENNQNIIIITAGTAGWAREHLSPGAIVRMFGEGLIGDYKTKMNTLRQVDDSIHTWTQDLDGLVNRMRNALEAGRLVDVAILLGQVDRRLKLVGNLSVKIQEVQQQAIREFEQNRQESLPLNFEKATGLAAQAGVWDDLKRKYVHRRFRNEKQYLAIKHLIDQTGKIVLDIKGQLVHLGKARASGRINDYLGGLKEISKLQHGFHNKFAPVYNTYLREPVQEAIKEQKAKMEEKRLEEVSQIPKTESVEKVPVTQPMTEQIPPTNPVSSDSVDVSFPVTEQPQTIPASLPTLQTLTSPPLDHSLPEVASKNPSDSFVNHPTELQFKPPYFGPTTQDKDIYEPVTEVHSEVETAPYSPPTLRSPLAQASHEWFVGELIKAARAYQDPYVLANMILKYSAEVEEYDEEKSLELLAIAEGILNE